MEKVTNLLLAFFFFLLAMVTQAIRDQDPKSVERWMHRIKHKQEKISTLEFYYHDTLTGSDPSSVLAAESNITNQFPTAFGSIYVMDDPLTEGPDPNSTLVGRAQGIYASTSKETISLLMVMNFVFISGDYNGSTLSLRGRNSIFDEYREMPIIGGSSYFRLARGIAIAETYSAIDGHEARDAVVKYTCVVKHYVDNNQSPLPISDRARSI